MNQRPIGILGGTFDPIHYGHLRLAEEMLEQAQLSEIRFIPTGTPPHRDAPRAGASHRLEMVRLALNGRKGFVLDDREVHRHDPCYTVDTLTALRAELGADLPLCLLMGGDAFLQLDTWHEWERLFELAHIIVGHRPGFPIDERMNEAKPALQRHFLSRRREAGALRDSPSGAVVVLSIPALDISATDLRQRITQHRSIRYLLPDSVADYIQLHHLYTSC